MTQTHDDAQSQVTEPRITEESNSTSSIDDRIQLLKETLQKRLDTHWPLTRLCNALEQNLNRPR